MGACHQRNLGSIHFCLLDGVTLGLGQPLAPEVDRHGVDSGVGGTLALYDLVQRDIRLSSIHGPQGQATLLQLGLGVIPILSKKKCQSFNK